MDTPTSKKAPFRKVLKKQLLENIFEMKTVKKK